MGTTKQLAMNTSVTMHGNVLTDIRIAKQAGYAGIELQQHHLARYLELNLPLSRLLEELDGLRISAVGCLHDIANYNLPDEPFLEKVEKFCQVAAALHAPMIQATTGPVDSYFNRNFHLGLIPPDDRRYRDVWGLSSEDQIKFTAVGLKKVADIAKKYNLKLMFEPLAACPVNKVSQALRIIEESGCDNVGLVLDFWHMWTAGETPEFAASIRKELIYNVHVCDGLNFDRSTWPIEPELRDVWLGEGAIPLQEWIQAVKSTGYDGWYTCESFCKRAFEEDPLKSAQTLKNYMEFLLM